MADYFCNIFCFYSKKLGLFYDFLLASFILGFVFIIAWYHTLVVMKVWFFVKK